MNFTKFQIMFKINFNIKKLISLKIVSREDADSISRYKYFLSYLSTLHVQVKAVNFRLFWLALIFKVATYCMLCRRPHFSKIPVYSNSLIYSLVLSVASHNTFEPFICVNVASFVWTSKKPFVLFDQNKTFGSWCKTGSLILFSATFSRDLTRIIVSLLSKSRDFSKVCLCASWDN